MCKQKPFVFGIPAEGENFIGREKEIKRLSANFQHGVNSILISPRRYGKTSLVKKVADMVKSDKLLVVHFDAFPCRSEYDFYNQFSSAILRQTSSRIDEWKLYAHDFVARLMPKISIGSDVTQEMSVSLGITPKTHTPEEVLNLPEVVANNRKCQIVICIDEFQQVGEFPESLAIQKLMRTIWQHQKNVSYCLFGSKKHLMNTLFQSRSCPFYKFGDTLFLDNIPTETWIPYLRGQFLKEGKILSEELAVKLCGMVNLNSSYVQQLAHITLLNTEKETTEADLQASFGDLLDENTLLFTKQTESLTTYQFNFLRAILSGVKKDFGLANVRDEYGLGSASNIARIKTALIEQELIDQTAEGFDFADPVMRAWFEQKWR